MRRRTRQRAREARDALLVLLGVGSAGMGLEGFLLPARFIDGGVTGVSMLLAEVLRLPLSVLILVINIPFVFLGYQQIGRRFAAKSAAAIGALALALRLVDFPTITSDALLSAVFGGFFIGAGIGLAIRGGAVLDGTEIAALLVSKYSDLLRVGDVILVFNIAIFGVAMFFLGPEAALYSILTYVSASKTVDFLLHGIEEYNAVVIHSRKSEPIKEAILRQLGRGVTGYRARGGMSAEEREILYCVVTRLEIGKVKTIAREIDRRAFILVHPLADAEGGVLKRTLRH